MRVTYDLRKRTKEQHSLASVFSHNGRHRQIANDCTDIVARHNQGGFMQCQWSAWEWRAWFLKGQKIGC